VLVGVPFRVNPFRMNTNPDPSRGVRTPETVEKLFVCVTLNEVKGLNSLR
jgi:hypothetical protein